MEKSRPVVNRRGCLMQLLGCVELWIALSLIFILGIRLSEGADRGSPLWYLDPLHSIVYLVLMWLPRLGWQTNGWITSRTWASVAFCLIAWCSCMVYELTLRITPGSYGGMHPKTAGSFLIAQGFYVPLVIGGWWLVRRYHLTWHELFFVAGMTGCYEVTMFGIPFILSAFYLAPIIIAYYFVVYSRFLSTSLLLVDERLIWDHSQRKVSLVFKLVCGIVLCLVSWLLFALWGECMIRVFDNFESYP